MRIRTTLLAGFLLHSFFLGFVHAVFAQTPKYPYQKYENRKEGIVPPRQLVAGEKLVLVAAAVENHETILPANVSQYRLAFYVKDQAKLKIVVREFEKLYKMEPLQNRYPSGLQEFSWPARIPCYYKIALQDLYPLATIAGTGEQQIVPVVLFGATPQNPELCYRFCFVAFQNISLLQYKIYCSASRELVYSDALSDLRADQRICLRWPAKDKNNNSVSDGLYSLVVEATFKPPLGVPARKTASVYQFYHYMKILKGEWMVRQ